MGLTTGFINGVTGGDVGVALVEKSYLIDRYPELADTFKQAGLWIWGKNDFGQLGDTTLLNKSSPIQTVAAGTNWKQVSAGAGNVAAIKTDGTLWVWGDGSNGQLGDNTVTPKSSPVQTVAGGTNWKQVSCGDLLTAAIKTDGTLWLWGNNNAGQSGDNTTSTKSSPVQTISAGTNWKQVAISYGGTAAIKTDGTLWIWGNGFYGRIGDNTIVSKSSPVQTIAGGTNWKQAACGEYHVTAIKTDGTLWSWGRNDSGQLGDNTIVNKSSPVQTVAGGSSWSQITCGFSCTAAIKTDGTLWSWGNNSSGNLGDNTVVSRSSPVQTVAGGTNWKQVSCGIDFTTMAIKTDGTLWLWGINSWGAIGNNSQLPKSSPVQTVAGGTNWKQISSGVSSVAAIRDDSSDVFGNYV